MPTPSSSGPARPPPSTPSWPRPETGARRPSIVLGAWDAHPQGVHIMVNRRRLGVSVLAGLLMAAPTLVGLVAPGAPAGAYADVGASFSGLGCVTSSGTNTSSWGWVEAPAGAVRARFTIVGGGGAAGDNYDGTGGAGGPGNIVNGTLPISAGQRIWVRLGCGGTDALSWEDWNGRR